MKFDRCSGILMHISSLPSDYGIGDFGKEAYSFVDFLHQSGQKIWQILPLGPTGYGNSPYQSVSSFAGNLLFIDFSEFLNDGLVSKDDISKLKSVNHFDFVDYNVIIKEKENILLQLYDRVKNSEYLSKNNDEYEKFLLENKFWIDDYALFMTISQEFNNKSWNKWPKSIRYRFKNAIKDIIDVSRDKLNYHKFVQFIFYKQWNKLKKYANDKGIKIVGDIPIFVSTNSADAWSYQKLYEFDKHSHPKKVAGCPPDYFSKTGQLWGNILYDWNEIRRQNYKWWIQRVKHCFKLYDIVRIDHFRGFESFWSIPAKDKTAENGRWVKGPGIDLFNTIGRKLGELPIIAEDLGAMTDKVKKLLEKTGFPGMKILQFAFDYPDSDYLPRKYPDNSIAYTGTHDNDTVIGWYKKIPDNIRNYVDEYVGNYLGSDYNEFEINFKLIASIWRSKACIAIAPIQDFIGLDSEGRMNTPSTVGSNWSWRVKKECFNEDLAKKILYITKNENR